MVVPKAFGNLHAIQRGHLDSLLYSHQSQARIADIKGLTVMWAQRLLTLGFAALVVLFIPAWMSPPQVTALNQFLRIAT
jgi:hypothetical protein